MSWKNTHITSDSDYTCLLPLLKYQLINDIRAEYLMAGKGYDSNDVMRLEKKKMTLVIHPK
ncbi:MAG: hypothetical protein LBB34_02075 [Holosporales bacterium]|jgi:hypothetical protein|nr:hypothetical protein [Holosporales bacterium]